MTERDLDSRREEERAPVEEAGGGEAEGFEQAEEQLERNASHEDAGADPGRDAFPPEAESDRSGAEYGEPDGVDESDQLPEDAPSDVAEDDTPGDSRDDASESAGAADESDPGQATGHPDNAAG
jgi:hypothetical protein